MPPWDPQSSFQACWRKLAIWKATLPPPFQLLPETIFARHSQHQLSALAMLHIWHAQCMAELCRIAFPGFPESADSSMLASAPSDWVDGAQRACLFHSRQVGEIIRTVHRYVGAETFVFLESSLPICVYESMRVQLLNIFMVPQEQQSAVLEEARSNFEIMLSTVQKMGTYYRTSMWLVSRRIVRARSN